MKAWDSHAVLIWDEGKEAQHRRLTRRMGVHNPIPSAYGMWESGNVTKNIPLEHILEDPVFKPSEQSYFIQLTDFAAYALLRCEHPLPSRSKYGLHTAFDVLAPVLVTAASRTDPEGIIRSKRDAREIPGDRSRAYIPPPGAGSVLRCGVYLLPLTGQAPKPSRGGPAAVPRKTAKRGETRGNDGLHREQPHSRERGSDLGKRPPTSGAGDGNRTRTTSLEGWSSKPSELRLSATIPPWSRADPRVFLCPAFIPPSRHPTRCDPRLERGRLPCTDRDSASLRARFPE